MGDLLNPKELKALRENFLELDKNRNGKISMNELKEGMKKKNIPFKESMFDLYDHNGDGLITFEDYAKSYIQAKYGGKNPKCFTWS